MDVLWTLMQHVVWHRQTIQKWNYAQWCLWHFIAENKIIQFSVMHLFTLNMNTWHCKEKTLSPPPSQPLMLLLLPKQLENVQIYKFDWKIYKEILTNCHIYKLQFFNNGWMERCMCFTYAAAKIPIRSTFGMEYYLAHNIAECVLTKGKIRTIEYRSNFDDCCDCKEIEESENV